MTGDFDHECCAVGGFTYDLAAAHSAGLEIVRDAERLAAIIESGSTDLTRRPEPETWSALEYACLVRDVLLVQRERVLLARREAQPNLVPMGRDERVEHDGYNRQLPADVGRQLRDAAMMFAGDLERLGDDWDRTLVYNYPAPTIRDLRWVAVHTQHEMHHHLTDVRRQTGEYEEG